MLKEAESVDFHVEMADMGVHILLLLPNGTSSTAEIDQLHLLFKPRCSKSTYQVVGKKMAACTAAQKKREEARKKRAAVNQAAAVAIGNDIEDSDVESSNSNNDENVKKGRRFRVFVI